MVRGLTVAMLLSSVAVLAGCESGFSDQEAVARCDEELAARKGGQADSCMTEEAYDLCLSAYTECGEDVEILETCPTKFQCAAAEDVPPDGE